MLLVGVGDRSPRALRRAGAELGRRIVDGADRRHQHRRRRGGGRRAAFAEGVLLGGYHSTASPARPARSGLARLLVGAARSGTGDWPEALRQAAVTAGAVALARDLANTPSAVKCPQWLAAEAVRAAAEHGVRARVWSPDELAGAGFGGILAVGSGSARPPRLIELSYEPDQPAGDVPIRPGRQGHHLRQRRPVAEAQRRT